MDARDALMVGTNSEGKAVARPLAPHLQIYRPQITSVLSSLHRITGLGIGFGTVLLVWWLMAVAGSPAAFARVQWFLGSWLGVLLLLGWTAAVFFHLCNGIRHLWWDTTRGLTNPQVVSSGVAVLIATAVLTVLAVIVAVLV